MYSITVIRNLLDEIIPILSVAGENNWNKAMQDFRNRCDSVSDPFDQKNLISDLLRIYGGMGSFSDLILYNQGNLLQKETSQLDALRRELFETANGMI
ncbi:MAG: hypothetical protein HY911_06435 [Desulfobacterales bacterium]|nr:hypothetical protein [Desulfobacterales bacterium]